MSGWLKCSRDQRARASQQQRRPRSQEQTELQPAVVVSCALRTIRWVGVPGADFESSPQQQTDEANLIPFLLCINSRLYEYICASYGSP